MMSHSMMEFDMLYTGRANKNYLTFIVPVMKG